MKEDFILNEIIWCEGKWTQPSGSKKAGRCSEVRGAAQKQSSALKMERARWVHTSCSQKPWNTNKKNVNKRELHKNKILFFVLKLLLHIQSTRGPSNNRMNWSRLWIKSAWTIWHHAGYRTEFEQPSFSVGVEEGVCEVVPVVLWDLEGFVLDAVVQILQMNRRTCWVIGLH